MRLVGFFVRMIFFVFVFTIDVKVKASEHAAPAKEAHASAHHAEKHDGDHKPEKHAEKKEKKVIGPREMLGQHLPENCWKDEKITCAVQSSESRFEELQMGESQLVLEAGSLIVRLSPTEIRLVKGGVWVKAKSAIQVKTEFGAYRSSKGEFAVFRGDEKVSVSSITGSVGMTARGANESLVVPNGMENWLGKVDDTGVASHGIPSPIVFESFLKRRAKIYRGDIEDFAKEAKSFHSVWQTAAKESAAIHQALYDKRVAELRDEHQKAEAARNKVESRNRELRSLFQRKLAGEE